MSANSFVPGTAFEALYLGRLYRVRVFYEALAVVEAVWDQPEVRPFRRDRRQGRWAHLVDTGDPSIPHPSSSYSSFLQQVDPYLSGHPRFKIARLYKKHGRGAICQMFWNYSLWFHNREGEHAPEGSFGNALSQMDRVKQPVGRNFGRHTRWDVIRALPEPLRKRHEAVLPLLLPEY